MIGQTNATSSNAVRKTNDIAHFLAIEGEIFQYIGETTNEYIKGYFYKYSNGEITQINVQPVAQIIRY